MDFVHLHVHSHFSLLDGGNRIPDLVKNAAAQGMKALALTDHGNLYGAVDFYKAATAAGIKPILGLEAYISPTTRQDRTAASQSDASYHLLLLAANQTGWRNLMKLSSRSFLEGFYYKPRLDRELLAQFSEGLICTTSCLGGEVPSAFNKERPADARRIAGEYRDIFGAERFFIEIQNQGEKEQDKVNPMLIRLAGELGVGVVGTNDVHFLRRSDKRSHEVLTCISTNKKLTDPDILRYSAELYLKSPDEMNESLGMWPEALRNTVRIAEMCDLKMDFKKHLPVFRAPDDSPPGAYLRQLAWAGLAARFGEVEPPEEYRKRLEWELKVIEDKGYSSYFLIVNDFVQFARRNQIPAAPRGSGVATLLGYALGMADVDPLQYGLLFERFTDPQRQEDPDVDIDICQEGRERVIQYVREKYGHVAQIITYGRLMPRGVIRDVGRVLDVPLDEVDRIAKQVPDDVKVRTLEMAMEQNPELRRMYEDESRPHIREILDHGMALEGLARHPGVHAAGVVVCDEPLENLIPLCRQSDSPDAITQWDGPTCEKAGMMKMDFLGLRTLTILQRARELVRARTGEDLDPEKLALDDQRVYELFRNGETDGVFQFESEGMKGFLKKMQPNRIGDLIAANAMYRPGPMDLIDSYCQRKKRERPVEKVHALVDDILAETYGIMVYQEQVMQVLNRLGQLSLSRSLSLIKAISKKKKDVIDAERPAFLEGAQRNGIDAVEGERLFDLILKFAGYGFNKAHSTRYAIVAYQTAWFKCYHPREFFAATLTYESGDQDKVVQYMEDARRMGITIAPPDVNTCASQFMVDGARVRFGLKAVKGVGEAAVEAILKARNEGGVFRSLFDFCGRVDQRAVNRSTIEALIKCGAFDGCGALRAALMMAVDGAVQGGQQQARDRLKGQLNFFDAGAGASAHEPAYPNVPPWSRQELLAAEKDTLGFYVTSHPLADYAVEVRTLNHPRGLSLGKVEQFGQDSVVGLAGMVSSVREIITKNGKSAGQKMAILAIEDLAGHGEAVLFAEDYKKFGALVREGAMVYLRGTLDKTRQKPNVKVNEVLPLEQAGEAVAAGVILRVPVTHLEDPERMASFLALVREHPGRCPLTLHVQGAADLCKYFVMETGRSWGVTPDRAFLKAAVRLLGEQNVLLEPRPPERRARWGGGRGGGE